VRERERERECVCVYIYMYIYIGCSYCQCVTDGVNPHKASKTNKTVWKKRVDLDKLYANYY